MLRLAARDECLGFKLWGQFPTQLPWSPRCLGMFGCLCVCLVQRTGWAAGQSFYMGAVVARASHLHCGQCLESLLAASGLPWCWPWAVLCLWAAFPPAVTQGPQLWAIWCLIPISTTALPWVTFWGDRRGEQGSCSSSEWHWAGAPGALPGLCIHKNPHTNKDF